MKYLKCFESFLILEAELKHSEFLKKEVEKIYQQAVKEIEAERNQRNSKLGMLDKFSKWLDLPSAKKSETEYLKKYLENEIENPITSIQCKVTDIIYPQIKQQIGAIILKKQVDNYMKKETLNIFEDSFVEEVEQCIVTKKLSPNMQSILDSAVINLDVFVKYDEGKEFISLGSLISYGVDEFAQLIIDKKNCGNWGIKLNLFEQCREDVSGTIRHELQHLTQKLCSYCLGICEEFKRIKKSNKDKEISISLFPNWMSNVYAETSKETKVGLTKTKTGLDQNDDITNNPEKLKIAYKKIYKDELDLDSEDELNRAKRLKYLLDDLEFKPWVSEKSNTYVKDFIDEEFVTLKDTETEFRKKLPNKYSLEEVANAITKYILENDEEVIIFKKFRKETAAEILKLTTTALEKSGRFR